MNTYISKLTIAIVAVLVIGLGAAIPAMAYPEPPAAARAAITKRIVTPTGTTIPESNFTFEFQQMARDRATGDLSVMDSDDLSFIETTLSASVSFEAGAYHMAETEDFLAGVTWPHAGDFIFIVSETANTNTLAANEHMTYSSESFIVVVSVINHYGLLIPAGAFALPATPGTEGTLPQDSDPDSKIDPTPGTPGEDGEPGTFSNLQFSNVFSRDIIGTFDDPALEVTKDVVGVYANLILPFEFTLNLGIPAEALDRAEPFAFAQPAVATILDAEGDVVRTVPIEGTMPNFTLDFTLSAGERLAIPVLPAGTTFLAAEAQQPEYNGDLDVVVGGTLVVSYEEAEGDDIAMAIARNLSDAGRNAADFTNTHNHSPLTGLIIGSMPILAIIIGATLALSMMVASRSRQRVEQMSLLYY